MRWCAGRSRMSASRISWIGSMPTTTGIRCSPGGEKQRLGFARMLIQNPTMIVMDEATAALDPSSQDRLMRLVLERLPAATLVSVAHRVELEAFHTRKLVLEYRDEGARLVGDEALHPAAYAGASKSRDNSPDASSSARSRLRECRPHAIESACSCGRLPRHGTGPHWAGASASTRSRFRACRHQAIERACSCGRVPRHGAGPRSECVAEFVLAWSEFDLAEGQLGVRRF